MSRRATIGGMTKAALLLTALGLTVSTTEVLAQDSPPPPPERQDACVRCHLELEEGLAPGEMVLGRFFADVHVERGLGCADCHGGDPTAFGDEDAAMWDARDFRGVPDKTELPDFCGRCHADLTFMRRYNPGAETDQVDQYFTSRHGELLRQGEHRVAACVDCHGVHGILMASDPASPVYPLNVPATCARCHADADLMGEFGLETAQYEEYAASVHGVALLERRDLAAPACNGCHGNHGATPPGVANIANVCGHCHANNQSLFQQSHVREAFVAADVPLCIACHEKHAIVAPTDAMLDWSSGEAVCRRCHEEGHASQHFASLFYGIIDTLKTNLARAQFSVERAEMRGMEVADLLFDLENAHTALIRTRTSIHAFNEEIVRETAGPGNAAALAAIGGAEALLDEFAFRRRGLLASSLIITFLVIMIWLKVRQIERRGD